MKLYIILALLGLLLAGCTTPAPEAPANESMETNETPSVPEVKPPEVKDCGTDMNCFIAEAEDCSKAKMDYSMMVNFFGTKINTTSFMQVNGTEMDKCLFYIRTDSVDIRYDANMTQALLESGKTIEEIHALEKNLSDTAMLSENRLDELCRFNKSSDLAQMLRIWQSGKFTSSDYDNAECTGNINK